MSWNLPRIINNLEAEINTGYVKDPAGYIIILLCEI